MLKVMSPLIETVDYGQQFLIMGVIPDFRSLEFSTIKCYWSPMELGNIQTPIGLQEDTSKGKI